MKAPKRVLLTGGTGLLGKEAIDPLLAAGFEVYITTSRDHFPLNHVEYVRADLLADQDIKKTFLTIKPNYLLHFAWIASGDYLNSDLNYHWRDASLSILQEFAHNGGQRVVFAGTCLEYALGATRLDEDSPLNPTSIYAKCKAELNVKAVQYARRNGLSFGWGRIFYVVGHGESEARLMPYLISSFKRGHPVSVNKGLVRDYLYSKDIGAAFSKFLESDIIGNVNICRGYGVRIDELALLVAEKLGRPELVNTVTPRDQPLSIVGGNHRLTKEVGYTYRYTISDAISNILDDYTIR